jgi:hypothetical protein
MAASHRLSDRESAELDRLRAEVAQLRADNDRLKSDWAKVMNKNIFRIEADWRSPESFAVRRPDGNGWRHYPTREAAVRAWRGMVGLSEDI